jgi:uncharacterized protein GlcG (DUF336 family)
MLNIPLEQADQIASATLAKGKELNLAPLTVAILDSGGHAVVIKRGDGSSIIRPQLASAKAWGARARGFGNRELARRADRQPALYGALNAISAGRMAPVAGGALLRDAQNQVVGAIGVSGDTSDNDEKSFLDAVRAAGLRADTGEADH